MPEFNFDNAGKWIKDHKEIVIPAAVIGGALALYTLSKGGGFNTGGASTGAGDGIGDGAGAGAGGTDAGYGEQISALQEQFAQSQTQNESALSGILSQFSAFQDQIANAISSLTGQTNAALASQAEQTNAALAALGQQQQSYGDNGIGQLLAQLPAYLAPAQNYGQPTIPDYSDNILGGISRLPDPVRRVAASAQNAGAGVQRSSGGRLITPSPRIPESFQNFYRNLIPSSRVTRPTQTTLGNLMNRVNRLYPQPTSRPKLFQPQLTAKRTIGKINTQYGRGH